MYPANCSRFFFFFFCQHISTILCKFIQLFVQLFCLLLSDSLMLLRMAIILSSIFHQFLINSTHVLCYLQHICSTIIGLICIKTYMYICTYIHIYEVCRQINTYKKTYIHTYVYIFLSRFKHKWVHMHVCTLVCMCISVLK